LNYYQAKFRAEKPEEKYMLRPGRLATMWKYKCG